MSGKTVRVNQEAANKGPGFIDGSSDDELMVQQQAFPVGSLASSSAIGNEQQELADDVNEHLNAEMFKKTQKKIIDIDIVASPAELAGNTGINVWRLPPHLLNQLKYNTALKNRDTAGGEHLAGNLNRCIPLGLRIIQQQNQFPFAVGVRAPGVMMDENLHGHGACLWRVPGQTSTMMVGESAFSPVNVVNRYAYDNYRMCTVEDLMHDVTFPEGRAAKGRASITVNSLAYQTLVQSLQAGNWQDQLHDINVNQVLNPERNLTVEVTDRIGRDIVNFLKPQVEAAADSFVSLEDLRFEIVRADSQKSYDSAKNLIGEIVANNAVDGKKLKSEQLQTRYSFHIKAEFSFVLF